MTRTETAPGGAGTGYVHPEVLVDTDWVAQHLDDPTRAHRGGGRRSAAL